MMSRKEKACEVDSQGASIDRLSSAKSFSFVRRLSVIAIAVVVTAQSVGCSPCRPRINWKKIAEKPVLCYRDTVWAKRAYNLRYGNCERKYGPHFQQGFIDGYCGVCRGGDGYVPAMPPKDYWSYEYQCAEGSKCVNAWFEGYPAGAQAAKKDGGGSFNDVYISKMIDAAVQQENNAGELPNSKPAPQVNRPPVSNVQPPIPTGTSMIEFEGSPTMMERQYMNNASAPMPMVVQPASFDPSIRN